MTALTTPPGKHPSPRDLELSEWYNAQSSMAQDRVREIIAETVEQTAFNMLAVLDGVAPAGIGAAHLELSAVDGDERVVLNNTNDEELHRLFAQSRACADGAEESGVSAYDVGKFSELKERQKLSDLLHLHRVPTKFHASQTIEGYDALIAPCIALPHAEHRRVESE